MTNSALRSKIPAEHTEKVTIPENAVLSITKGELRILLHGLCVWNCPAIDMLSKKGLERLYAAQDLIERLWKEQA